MQNELEVSPLGLQFITREEGSRADSYQDQVGVWTIGVGHTGPDVRDGLHWTQDQILGALRSDSSFAAACIKQACQSPLTQFQFDALVSFVFNVGVVAFGSSTMLKLLNDSQFEAAAEQFDRWDKATRGGILIELPVLKARRARERLLFSTGEYGL